MISMAEVEDLLNQVDRLAPQSRQERSLVSDVRFALLELSQSVPVASAERRESTPDQGRQSFTRTFANFAEA